MHIGGLPGAKSRYARESPPGPRCVGETEGGSFVVCAGQQIAITHLFPIERVQVPESLESRLLWIEIPTVVIDLVVVDLEISESFGSRISDHRPDELPGSGVGGVEVLLLIGCAEHLAVHPLLEPVRMFSEEAECVLADHQWRNPQAGMYRSRRQWMETAPPSDLVRSGEAFSLSVSFYSLALSIYQILL